MESGFISIIDMESDAEWHPIVHKGSCRFEFFKVRHFGALHFIKRPAPEYRHDLVTTESLKKEFYIGYNLNHPSIVRYLRMEGGAVYEEYIDGYSLREMIEKNDERLSSPEFIERVCRQLIEATVYLHSRGVIHNDIKPENVMISRIGDRLKLIDFGCATTDMWDATEGYTPAYKAPEQGEGTTNIHTDIFLIGKLMEELAPKAGVTRLWSKFIKKATSEDISGRYSSDQEALAAIPRRWGIAKWKATAGIILLSVICLVLTFLSIRRERSSLSEMPSESLSMVLNTYDSLSPAGRDVAVKDITVRSDSVLSPINDVSHYVEAVATKDIKEAIDDDLLRFASDLYDRRIFPQCRKRSKYIYAVDVEDCDIRIKEKTKKTESEILNYAEQLALKNPDHSDYCRLQASAVIDAKNRQVEKMISDNPPILQPYPRPDPTIYTPMDKIDGEPVYFLGDLDRQPEFPGGDDAMWKWWKTHKTYPEKSKKNGVEGTVDMTFVIKKDGSIARACVLKGLDEEIDKGIVKMLNAMPKWTPGMKNGEYVNCRFERSLFFDLPDD